jgi:hypothetical protein
MSDVTISRALLRRALVAAALALTLVALPGRAEPPDGALGAAPMRDVDQDISHWPKPIVPKVAPSRADVVRLYQGKYVPTGAVALTWTGSVPGCAAGTTNAAHQQAVIDRVSYFRELAGLPTVALGGGPPVAQMQAAALMMSANNALSHAPPSSWTCFSSEGAAGAASANIFLGRNGVLAVDGYVDDFGTTNAAAGHRRWILFPPRTTMATGDIAGGNTPPRPTNALHVFGASGTRPVTSNGVAWPPEGHVPYQNLPATSKRWSFSFPGADFSNATVAVQGPQGPLAASLEPLANGFGDNTIVFVVNDASYVRPAADASYRVTVSNVAGNGVPSSFSYTVTVIDPDAAPPVTPSAAAVEFYNAALDHYFVTHLANEIALLDAGTQIRGWTRTGRSIPVYTAAGPGTSPVCRVYIPPEQGNSHFYGRGTTECTEAGEKFPTSQFEDMNSFHIALPSAGNCPAGTVPIYRVYSNRADANHRYTTARAVRDQMVGLGWVAEGEGADLVVMCGPA